MKSAAKNKAKVEDDWWDKLPKEVQAEIDEALADLDEGKGIPHEIVATMLWGKQTG